MDAKERKRRPAGVSWELLPGAKGKMNASLGENIPS